MTAAKHPPDRNGSKAFASEENSTTKRNPDDADEIKRTKWSTCQACYLLSLSLSLSAFCPLLWWALPNFWTSLASQLLPHLLGCVHGCGEHTGRFKFMSAVSAIKGWYPHGDGCRTQWCTGCCSGYVDKPWLSDQGNETLSTAVCETMREVWNGHYPFLPQLYWIFRVLHAVWTRQSNQTCK